MKRKVLLFLLPVWFLATFSTLALSQIQVTLNASKDNTLYQDTAGALSNGAGQHMFAGKNAGGRIRRALIAFDVAGGIPSGSSILSVTLTLNLSQTTSGSDTLTLSRVLADWGEGTSVGVGGGGGEGGGGPATTNDATWIHRFFNTVFWSTPGGDFATTPSASLSVIGLGTYVWGPTQGMVDDVQQWLDNPAGNFGWILMGRETSPISTKRFDTRQDTIPSSRPQLTVTYSPPASVRPDDPGPSTFALLQNYPNPFNPSTKIQFTIPAGTHGRASLRVYDILGREVATLVNGEISPGSHEVIFDGNKLASGMYYYQLRAGGFLETKRMMLVK